jgi:hypothetical protein
MQTDARERAARRFVCRNALVPDPVAALEAERQTAAWTPAERRVFLDKFLQFPKVRHLISAWCSWYDLVMLQEFLVWWTLVPWCFRCPNGSYRRCRSAVLLSY